MGTADTLGVRLTAINAFEFLIGARSEHDRERVAALLATLIILPVEEQSAARAAEARIHLESQGAGIGMADYLIAGVCLDKGGTLLTRNLAHFERVPHLNIGGRH